MKAWGQPEIEAQPRALIAQALETILRQMPLPPSPNQLAHSVGYSPSHFRYLFSAQYGEAPAHFARRLGLEHAAGQLSMTDQSIYEIAQRAGYVTAEGFAKAFRDHFGMAPSEFRVRNRGELRLMPAYIYASRGDSAYLPSEVGIVGRDSQVTTYMFAGMSLCSRIYPDPIA